MKRKIFVAILLLSVGGFILISHKPARNPVANVTVSYADSALPDYSLTADESGLINLSSLPTVLSVELSYASKDNFAGKEFYPKISEAYLLENTAQKLMAANEEFYKLGYRLKIHDAYRPYRYQQLLRDAAAEINPKTQGYIADPKYGSNHNRGASVDVTLTDLDGHELDMPTTYDYFGSAASINYTGCTAKEKSNRELLGTIMEKHGFRRISSEWWHFDDIDYLSYPLLDIDFIDLRNNYFF